MGLTTVRGPEWMTPQAAMPLTGASIQPRLLQEVHPSRMGSSFISSLAVLSTALLFGGMTLYSFGFAAFLFTALPAKTAGQALRKAFPWFYAFVIVTSAVAAVLWWPQSMVFASVMAAVAITTIPVRQLLMPAINRATDAGLRQRFKWLHALSVVVTLGHIAATGWLLANLV
jgi:hypothetical protein